MCLHRKLNKLVVRKHLITPLLFFLLVPFFLSHANEQTPPDRQQKQSYLEKRIVFEHLSLEQGLSQSSVTCIAQDRKGFMWFGTEGGLNRYDGYHFKVFKYLPDDSTSLSRNWIIGLYVDQQGTMWIMTTDGVLHQYNAEQENFKRFLISSLETDQRIFVNTILMDRNGTMWIGTAGQGLVTFNPQSPLNFACIKHNATDPYSLSSDFITSIYQDRSGNLWIGTNKGGLNKLVGNNRENSPSFMHYRFDSGDTRSISSDNVSCLIEDHTGRFWIGTDKGLNVFDLATEKFTRFKTNPDDPNSLSHNIITSLCEDRLNNLWIGTNDKLNRLAVSDPLPVNPIFCHYYKNPLDPCSGLNSDVVLSVFEDQAGVIWIGTHAGGINKIAPERNRFIHYKRELFNSQSLPGEIVWSFCEDHQGKLWVGLAGGGLCRIDRDKNRFKNFLPVPEQKNSIGNFAVLTILQESEGTFWIGTEFGGMYQMTCHEESSTPTFIRYRHDPEDAYSLSDNNVRSLCEDRNGNLWVGTYNGLNRFDKKNKRFARYQNDPQDPQSISCNSIQFIYEDKKGVLWIATYGGGLNKLVYDSLKTRQTFTRFQNVPGDTSSIAHNVVLSICEDREGNLWIGTDVALNKFNPKSEKFTLNGEKDGFPLDYIYGVLADDDRNIWFSTNQGLWKFNPQSGNVLNYTVVDGLQSNEFNLRACFKSKDGTMFFGGINGFNEFNPGQFSLNPCPPNVVITDLRLFNKSVPIAKNNDDRSILEKTIAETQKIKLSHRDRAISFEFAALHFAIPENNQYAFKLEGIDDDWNYIGNQRSVTFSNLSPGDYTLRVKACNSDGVWNEDGVSLDIIIAPPFWLALWFKILVGIIFILSIYGFIVWRTKKIHQKKRALEIQVKEKTEAAQTLQNALSEVERLKSRLQAENIYLQNEINLEHNFENIITNSNCFKKILHQLEQVAATDSTVLIVGETGTGKELLARAIHSLSKRKNRPLIKVDCAALPPNLIESKLFGHEKGAFTGAISRKLGRFEIADKGTIFLDEVGEMPLELHTKLLRVLQEGEIQRIGCNQTIQVNVRIIAATNRDLENEINRGNFREDLFFRLNVFPIQIPPLRERKEDIPLLVRYFVKKYNAKFGCKIEMIPQHVIDTLWKYHWPGNVRELENIIQRSIILSNNSKLVLGEWIQKSSNGNNHASLESLEENERRYILKVLKQTDWRVSGEKGAAKILKVNPKTLFSRMEKLGIHRKHNFSDISEIS